MEAEKLDELTKKIREKYDGPLSLLTSEDVDILVQPPSRVVFERFQEMILEGGRKGVKASENLVKACLLHPTPKDFDTLLETKPGLATTFAKSLLKMAGAGEDAEEKKL